MGPQPLRVGGCVTGMPHPRASLVGQEPPLVVHEPRPGILDAYWVSLLAAYLELIVHAQGFDEAQEHAREGLEKLVDPFSGIRNIPDDLRLRWRIAARKKEPHG